MWIYLNGHLVDDARATVSVLDPGFLYGDGVFETVRIYDGHPVWLDRHLARLDQSCRAIHLAPPAPAHHWEDVFRRVIDKNRLDHALIRLTLSRGRDTDASDADAVPTVVAIPRPLPPITPEQRRHGVAVITAAIRKPSPLSYPTHAKTLNYVNSLLAKREATARNAFEGLQLTIDGSLAECAMSNIFFVTRDTLHTPSTDCGILPGITRAVILDVAPALGLHVREGRYPPAALLDADACFVTGSGIGVLPVATIDGRPLPHPSPDTCVARIQERYDRMLAEHRR